MQTLTPTPTEATELPPYSQSACQCAVCGRVFGSGRAFDKHRTGSYANFRRCRTPEEMKRAKLVLDERGVWIQQPGGR